VPAALPSGLRVLPPIRRALDAGAAVVALETSVIAQGLPVPENANAARVMVGAVERAGALAAFTAIVCGIPTLGLESADLERFLRRDGVRKVSARDLAVAMAQRADGATTVAATLALASRAGIAVMATGGIGGVHRALANAPHVRDESADLDELARTPMIVVCAGAKSILDLPSTWERLDTLGVPVIGFGTNEFPGFYTRTTGIPLTASTDSVEEVASIARAHRALGRGQAVLVVQPPPAGTELDADAVERAVTAALVQAAERGIRGAAVTPFLLTAVSQATGGRSLGVNLALLESNARLAGEIAVALQQNTAGGT
jgi:pseudouridine-5'-phosphate glycosidase